MNQPNCSMGTVPRTFWFEHGEASLNWLALGLLLAAWNAADNGVPSGAMQRPAALRGYAYVSVRAAHRSTVEPAPVAEIRRPLGNARHARSEFFSESHKSVNLL